MDVGLRDHGVEGLVDASAPLEDRRKEAARSQLGDLEVHVAGLGGRRARGRAVAARGPSHRAFVGLGADHLGGFGLDEGLIEELHELAHQIEIGSIAKCVEQLGWVKIVVGHRSFLFVPLVGHVKIAPVARSLCGPVSYTTSGDVNDTVVTPCDLML